MLNRDEALKLVQKYIKTENTVKHMLATEAIMRSLARKFKLTSLGSPARTDELVSDELVNEDEWGMAGLIHDLDYEVMKNEMEHSLKTIKILKEDEKVDLPESVYKTVLAHCCNYHPENKPQNLMEWSLFICDSLTGLITATTLVRPSKSLVDVKVKSVMKKFKQPSFAAGTRREDIAMCEEKLGIELRDFIELGLLAMKSISDDLGL